MTNVIEILGTNEFNDVINSGEIVFADFYASWCAPCKMQSPILIEFASEIGEKAKIIKIDVDQNPELASLYAVQSIPTIAVFKDGKLMEKTVGLTSKASLSEMLIKLL